MYISSKSINSAIKCYQFIINNCQIPTWFLMNIGTQACQLKEKKIEGFLEMWDFGDTAGAQKNVCLKYKVTYICIVCLGKRNVTYEKSRKNVLFIIWKNHSRSTNWRTWLCKATIVPPPAMILHDSSKRLVIMCFFFVFVILKIKTTLIYI